MQKISLVVEEIVLGVRFEIMKGGGSQKMCQIRWLGAGKYIGIEKKTLLEMMVSSATNGFVRGEICVRYYI